MSNKPEVTPEPDVTTPEETSGVANEAVDREELHKIREDNRQRRIGYLDVLQPGLANEVEVWKSKYGRLESQHILDQLYIYRGMNRGEYIALMSQGDDKLKNEQVIAEKCVLWPRQKWDWIILPAGLPTTLSDLVLANSAFGAQDPAPVRL